jgi:hypothetical protein
MAEKNEKYIGSISKKISSVKDDAKEFIKSSKKEIDETRLLVKIIMSAVKSYLKTKDFELDNEEKKFIKDQSADILKLIPLIVLQMVPGSSIATPFILKLSKKLGITLKSEIPTKHKKDGELAEFIDYDGAPIGSAIPILQDTMHPSRTLDQTVVATRQTGNPVARGYRVYYGESVNPENVIDEEDTSGAFGDDEVQDDRTYKECMESMKELGIEDFIERDERCKTFGFDKKLDKELKHQKNRGKCKDCFTKRRLSELENQKMEELIDEILLKKKNKDEDVVKKDDVDVNNPVIKILTRNLQAIKKLADKEGVTIQSLLKKVKDEQ